MGGPLDQYTLTARPIIWLSCIESLSVGAEPRWPVISVDRRQVFFAMSCIFSTPATNERDNPLQASPPFQSSGFDRQIQCDLRRSSSTPARISPRACSSAMVRTVSIYGINIPRGLVESARARGTCRAACICVGLAASAVYHPLTAQMWLLNKVCQDAISHSTFEEWVHTSQTERLGA